MIDHITHKVCTKCKLDKLLEAFSKGSKLGDRQQWCKQCKSTYYVTLYYPNNKDNICARNKIYNSSLEIKAYVSNRNRIYYGLPINLAKRMYRSAKGRAKKLGVVFNLTSEYIYSILPDPLVCPVFGMRLSIGSGNSKDNSPTIDRICPELGYIKGNITIMSSLANRIKSNATVEQIYSVIRWLERQHD